MTNVQFCFYGKVTYCGGFLTLHLREQRRCYFHGHNSQVVFDQIPTFLLVDKSLILIGFVEYFLDG